MDYKSLQEEKAKIDKEWAKLRQAKDELEKDRKAFEDEKQDSGVEFKLFVGNLNPTTTEEEFRKYFTPFGVIKECVLLVDKDGKSKRSGFVKYYSKKAADDAITAHNERTLDQGMEVPLVVRLAQKKLPQVQPFGQPQTPSPYPAYTPSPYPRPPYPAVAPPSPYAQSPYPQPNPYGQPNPYQTPAPYGQPPSPYGQPTAYQPYPAARGYAQPVPPQTQSTNGAPGKWKGPPGSNLYVNNLDRFVTEGDVRAMFSEFGNVISVKLFPEHGYGFVSFDSAQSAQNAIAALHGMVSSDGSKHLEVTVKKEGPRESKTKGSTKEGSSSRFAPY